MDLDIPSLSQVVPKNLAVKVYIPILQYKNIRSEMLIAVEVRITAHCSNLALIELCYVSSVPSCSVAGLHAVLRSEQATEATAFYP